MTMGPSENKFASKAYLKIGAIAAFVAALAAFLSNLETVGNFYENYIAEKDNKNPFEFEQLEFSEVLWSHMRLAQRREDQLYIYRIELKIRFKEPRFNDHLYFQHIEPVKFEVFDNVESRKKIGFFMEYESYLSAAESQDDYFAFGLDTENRNGWYIDNLFLSDPNIKEGDTLRVTANKRLSWDLEVPRIEWRETRNRAGGVIFSTRLRKVIDVDAYEYPVFSNAIWKVDSNDKIVIEYEVDNYSKEAISFKEIIIEPPSIACAAAKADPDFSPVTISIGPKKVCFRPAGYYENPYSCEEEDGYPPISVSVDEGSESNFFGTANWAGTSCGGVDEGAARLTIPVSLKIDSRTLRSGRLILNWPATESGNTSSIHEATTAGEAYNKLRHNFLEHLENNRLVVTLRGSQGVQLTRRVDR